MRSLTKSSKIDQTRDRIKALFRCLAITQIKQTKSSTGVLTN